MLANRAIGNGSSAVCDNGPVSSGGGGIPGFDPPSFAATQSVTDALVDFACRVDVHQVSAPNPCTLNSSGVEEVLTAGGLPSSARQFCYLANVQNAKLALGDTIFAVQVRDTQGNLGPRQEVVLRRTQ